MPAFRVTAHDGTKEYAQRVEAADRNEAMRQHRVTSGHTVLRAEEEVAPAPRLDPLVSQLTRKQLRETIAQGVLVGMLVYAVIGALAFIIGVAMMRSA